MTKARATKKAKKPPRDQDVIEAALAEQPVLNLEMIETEVQRQRDLMGRKMGSAYTRATVLIGAAGVLGGVSATGAFSSRFVLLALLGVLLYVAAAVFGLVSMRPMKGDEVDVDDAVLRSKGLDTVELKRAFVASHLKAHADYEDVLDWRSRLIVRGFAILGVAWIVAAGATALGVLYPDPTKPVHVIIDKEPSWPTTTTTTSPLQSP